MRGCALGRWTWLMWLLLAPAPVLAQATGGVKGGLNLASLTGDFASGVTVGRTPLKTRVLPGPTFGAFALFPVSDFVAVQPEFLYTQEGFSGSGPLVGFGSAASIERLHVAIDVLRVPVLLRIGPLAPSGTHGFALAGLALGFPLRSRIDVNDLPAYTQEGGLRANDLALVVGAGTTISRFLIEGRFTQGLTDINRQRPAGAGFLLVYDSHKTQVITMMAGVRF